MLRIADFLYPSAFAFFTTSFSQFYLRCTSSHVLVITLSHVLSTVLLSGKVYIYIIYIYFSVLTSRKATPT